MTTSNRFTPSTSIADTKPASQSSLSTLISYPFRGDDSSARFGIAILMWYTSLTMVPQLYWAGYMWLTARTVVANYCEPPALNNWGLVFRVAWKAITVLLLTLVLPIVVVFGLLIVVSNPVDISLLEILGYFGIALLVSAPLWTFISPGLFVQCAAANSFSPLFRVESYARLMSSEYLKTYVAVTSLGACLAFGSVLALIPPLSWVSGVVAGPVIMWFSVFSTAAYTASLVPSKERPTSHQNW